MLGFRVRIGLSENHIGITRHPGEGLVCITKRKRTTAQWKTEVGLCTEKGCGADGYPGLAWCLLEERKAVLS